MERRKIKIFLISGLLILVVCSNMTIAKNSSNGAGRSKQSHLYLFEKDPTTWEIVENGSWGKMKYTREGSTFDFVFNGHELGINESYTLIYYPDPWPGMGLKYLGSDISNEEGNIHIKESIDTGDLPIFDDYNCREGAKIWLVLSSDVDVENAMMIGWNPTEYLFENELIFFDDSDE